MHWTSVWLGFGWHPPSPQPLPSPLPQTVSNSRSTSSQGAAMIKSVQRSSHKIVERKSPKDDSMGCWWHSKKMLRNVRGRGERGCLRKSRKFSWEIAISNWLNGRKINFDIFAIDNILLYEYSSHFFILSSMLSRFPPFILLFLHILSLSDGKNICVCLNRAKFSCILDAEWVLGGIGGMLPAWGYIAGVGDVDDNDNDGSGVLSV